MDLDRQAKLANIGSFYVGVGSFILACVVVYLAFNPLVPIPANPGAGTPPVVTVPLITWAFIGSLVLAAVLHAFAAILHFRVAHIAPQTASQQHDTLTSSTPAIRKDDRIFVQSSIGHLASLCANHTALQAQYNTRPFIDKWLKVSGTIANIGRNTVGSEISIDFTYAGPSPAMWFDATWHERLAILNRGDSLTVIGQIKMVSEQIVRLDHCEIVEHQGNA